VVDILKCWDVAWLLVALFFVSVVPVSAEADEQGSGLPSTISFGGGGDSQGSNDSYVDLDYAFVGNSRLLLSLASNRSDGQDNPITTRNILLGFRSDPLQTFGVGVDLESWGEKGTLVSDTLRVIAEIKLDRWQFSLRPQWRKLTFSTDCIALILPRCDLEVVVNSTGTALDMSYFTDGPWSFSLGFAQQQYDKKVQALALDPRLQFVFSAATLDLSSGLEDRRSSVGISHYHNGNLWSLSRLRSVSKVSGDATLITSLRFSTDLTEQWRLRTRVGSQIPEGGGERVSFAGIGLGYSW
jgi:hypothetical protein